MIEIKKIKKRDGRIVEFNPEKITDAIFKAAQAVGGKDRSIAERLTKQVVELLEKKIKPGEIPTVEQVQDIVEKILIESGHAKTAKAYILYRQKRSQARKVKNALGIVDELKLPTNTLLILASRYLMKDETGKIKESTSHLFRRVAKAISEVEREYGKSEEEIKKLEEEFYRLMTNFEFLPNSPTLMNAGTGNNLNLSACFVIPVPDSMEGIFDALKTMAIVQKAGGGTGFSFSRLRPKGDIVKSTGGVASGPISFMKIFNAATEQIKQGGKRRGANMGILRVDHPDILDFIVCKEREGTLRNFNISVAITDKFMEALKKDEDFELINPRTNKVVKTMKAKAIWSLITTMAWKNGEPGIIFIDKINQHCNTTPKLGQIESTNPCVVGDTYVFTEEGWMKAKDLKVGCRIWTPKGWSFIEEVIDNGVKKISKVELSNGLEVLVTYDHKFLTRKGWKSVKELNPGDEIKIVYDFPDDYGLTFDKRKAEWLGYWVGDGDVTTSNHVSLYVGNDEKLANYFLPVTQQIAGNCSLITVNNQFRVDVHRKDFANLIRQMTGIKLSSSSSKKTVPKLILKSDPVAQRSFLRGLFSADGSIYNSNGTPTISLSSTSKELLKQVQLLLLSQGIPSTLTKEKMSGSKEINGKMYRTLPTFRILISGERTLIFYKKIGLLGNKAQKLEFLLKDKKFYSTVHKYEYVKIKKIESAGEERVFDIKAPPTFTWITNGILSLDCGEQPLLPYESCNLGSINLSKMVKEVDGKYEVDWDKLRYVVRLAVRFLDNVIDANVYPIKEIKEMTEGNRKIGLGVMGWADMLILLGIPYNSEEALKLAEKVMKFISDEGRKMSVELGKEKGNFPNFKDSVWPERGYTHLRNANITTIAPTGTISEIAGCSQGIEPLFAVGYLRNVSESLGTDLVIINPYFEQAAIKSGFYDESIMKRVLSSTSIQNIKEIPEEIRKVFVTAFDLKAEDHIKMQAAFQKYTDNSISKTINLPFESTPHDVEEAYMLAYDLGCLGVTIYRHGSREVQVLKPLTTPSPFGCEACQM